MPTKKKVSSSSKVSEDEPKKRFVVEEKSVTEKTSEQPIEEKGKPVVSLPETDIHVESEDKPVIENEKGDSENNNEELKKDETKDTIASSNITSFSLLDADKNKTNEIDMSNIEENKVENTPARYILSKALKALASANSATSPKLIVDQYYITSED